MRTRIPTCASCGHPAVRDATWCGWCGARHRGSTADAPPPPRHPPRPSGRAAPRPVAGGPRRRRLLAGALAAAVVAAAGVVATRRDAPAPPVAGRLDDTTGRSAAVAPPRDLEPRWLADVPPPTPRAPGVGEVGLRPAGRQHVALGTSVLGLVAGRSVVSQGAVGALDGARWAAVDGDELLHGDARDGLVEQRAPVVLSDGWRPTGAAVGWVEGEPLFLADGRLGRVGLDGTVRWVARQGTTAVEGARGRWALVRDAGPLWRVVDGRTGEVVLDVAREQRPAHVLADDLLVLREGTALVGLALPDGREVWRQPDVATADDPSLPRLLDRGDELLVVGGVPRSARRVAVADGRVTDRVVLGDGAVGGPTTVRSQVVATDRVLAFVAGDALLARDWRGLPLWRTELVDGDTARVQVVGDLVVLDEGGGELQLLDARDGTLVDRLPVVPPPPSRRLGPVREGALAVRGPPGAASELRWVDLDTGVVTREPPAADGATGGEGDATVVDAAVDPAGDTVLLRVGGADEGLALVGPDDVVATADVARLGPVEVLGSTTVGPVVRRPGADEDARALTWDGRVAWHTAPGRLLATVGDSVALRSATGDGVTVVAARDTGEVRWDGPASPVGPPVGPVEVDSRPALVVAGHASVAARAVDDGTVLWSSPLPALVAGAVVVADDQVVVPLADGSVVTRAVADGADGWTGDLRVRPDGRPTTEPLLGRVTAATTAGTDTFLGTADGRVLRFGAGGEPLGLQRVGAVPVGLVVVGDQLLVLTDDAVVALGPPFAAPGERDAVELPSDPS